MIAKDLLSNIILPVLPDNTAEQALSMMSVYHVKHLPVVKDDILLGILSEEDVASCPLDTKIRDIKISSTYIYVSAFDHVFEILSRLAENNITVVPVVDNNEKFLGLISQEDLIKFYANSFSFTEPGSIVVLETSKRGYVLSEVARVIELENASVIASFVNTNKGSEVTLLTLKINQQEISNIIAALERYGYKIQATFTEEEYEDDLKDRYDQLMNYLNV